MVTCNLPFTFCLVWNYHFKSKTCQSGQGVQLWQWLSISTTRSFWAVTFLTKYRTEFLPRRISLTGDEDIFSATQSKWHPLRDHSFTPHNGCFSLNMYFILFRYARIFFSICIWKLTHFKVNQKFPWTCKKSRILQNYFISQQVESQVLHSRNKPTLYFLLSHLLYTDPQKHNPPTPCSVYDKSSWCMAKSTILRDPETAAVYVFYQ